MTLLRFEEFSLDCVRRTLERSGKSVAVQPKVLACIEQFARHPGALITSQRLTHALWPNVHVAPEALRRVIRDARRVLGDSGDSQRFILTRKGFGYVFLGEVTVLDDHSNLTPNEVQTPWPFVGRTMELNALRSTLSRPAPLSRKCVISGEAGSGKSALLGELRRVLQDQYIWCVGHCRSGSDLPSFWPFRQIARALNDDLRVRPLVQAWVRSAPELVRLLPELTAEPIASTPKPPDDAQRMETCRAFVVLIGQLATLQPLAIAIEDLHYADTGSLLIVEQLLQETCTHALGVVVTCRREYLETVDFLCDLLSDDGGPEQLTDVELQGLATSEIVTLLERAHSPESTLGAAQTIHQLTGGNPLFVRQVVQQIGASRGVVAAELAGTLHEVILRRAERLPARSRQLLEAASVLGIETKRSFLSAITSAAPDQVREALQPVLTAGMMRMNEEDADALVFEHAQIRDAFYASLDDGSRESLHFAAFVALEHEKQRDASATHAYFARGRIPASRVRTLLVEAGKEALEHLAFDRGVVHLSRARECFDETADARERASIGLLWAWARWFADEPLDEVMDSFRAAACLARESGDVTLFAYAAMHCAVGDFSGVRRGMVSRQLQDLQRLEEAHRLLSPSANDMQLLMARSLVWMHTCLGDYEAAFAPARTALELAPNPPDARTETLDPLLSLAADMSSSPKIAALDAQLNMPPTNVTYRAEQALALAEVFMIIGEIERFESAEAMLEQSLAEWTRAPRGGRLGNRFALFVQERACMRLSGAVRQGALLEADRHLAAIIADTKRLQPLRGERPDMYVMLVVVFQLFWYRGRASAMEPLLDIHLQSYPEDEWLALIFRAQCAIERGELRLAREHYAKLRATSFKRPLAGRLTGLRVEARVRIATLCATIGTPEDAALLYPMLLPMQEHCGGETYVHWGANARALAELALKQGKIDDARRHVRYAHTMNTRIGHRPELVRTHVVSARILRALGRETDAQEHLAIARQEALAMGMAESFAQLERSRVEGNART
jgi:DNA-binding winged helix-turn-helix (wHTH) protein/tetratricopeptide (TPR) repeat protein